MPKIISKSKSQVKKLKSNKKTKKMRGGNPDNNNNNKLVELTNQGFTKPFIKFIKENYTVNYTVNKDIIHNAILLKNNGLSEEFIKQIKLGEKKIIDNCIKLRQNGFTESFMCNKRIISYLNDQPITNYINNSDNDNYINKCIKLKQQIIRKFKNIEEFEAFFIKINNHIFAPYGNIYMKYIIQLMNAGFSTKYILKPSTTHELVMDSRQIPEKIKTNNNFYKHQMKENMFVKYSIQLINAGFKEEEINIDNITKEQFKIIYPRHSSRHSSSRGSGSGSRSGSISKSH